MKTHMNCSRLAAVLLAGVLSIAGVRSAHAEDSHEHQLQGTWRVQVTLYNCANPTMQLPSFYSLLTFHKGGTESETTSNPGLLPGQRTSGYGIWYRVGRDSYEMATEAFILFDTPPTAPVPILAGTQKILQSIVVTDDRHFTSDGAVKFFAADGSNYRSGCAKSDGVRLSTDPDKP